MGILYLKSLKFLNLNICFLGGLFCHGRFYAITPYPPPSTTKDPKKVLNLFSTISFKIVTTATLFIPAKSKVFLGETPSDLRFKSSVV